MGRPDPRYFVVGHLNKAHGTKGELFVWPLTDHPEGTFAPGVVLRLAGGDAHEPDPDLPPLRVGASRPFKEGFLVTFNGVEERSEAELLRGYYLLREAAEVEPLGEGELFYHQLLGMRVETVEGVPVGEVAEVFEMTPADLLEVHGDGKVRIIPLRKEIVVEIDAAAGRIVIDPPEGLLDL